jgi:GntR family transcriptional regulator
MAMESPRPRVTRYQGLLNRLVAGIQAGKYPVGTLLPTEHQLCREFELSRFTVREALRRMTEMGLVVRAARQGTRVVSDQPLAAYVQPLDSIGEIMMHVTDTRLNVLATDVVAADEPLARLLRCEPGQEWLHVTGFRETRDDHLPMSWAEIYVHERYRDIQGEIGGSDQPIFELIAARYNDRIFEIEQDISATLVAPAVAVVLKVKPNSPALLVIRRTFNQRKETMLITINTQPADRHTFSIHVRENRAAVRHAVRDQG